MSATLSTETTAIDFPVVGFHAPFGDDNAKGMQIRVDAVFWSSRFRLHHLDEPERRGLESL